MGKEETRRINFLANSKKKSGSNSSAVQKVGFTALNMRKCAEARLNPLLCFLPTKLGAGKRASSVSFLSALRRSFVRKNVRKAIEDLFQCMALFKVIENSQYP